MNNLYGIHDFSLDWASIIKNKNKTGWTVVSEGIGDDPNDHSGQNYSNLANYNITPIVRLSYSHHGQGTIPLPDRYDEFAQRCANFVAASSGCSLWQLGNEPNLRGEQKDGIPILPHQYIDCYKKCRNAIKQRGLQHKVLTAAVAPYNVNTGSWMEYWTKMLENLTPEETDGFTLHFYSRGSDPASVSSNDKMNPPYQQYSNGFRAYRDFLEAVPISMRHLPVYATETDQIVAWEDKNNGWVKAAYQEIDTWNKQSWTQKILCLVLYRWENFDQWGIKGKNGVIQDFSEAVDKGYESPTPIPPLEPEKKQEPIFMPKISAPEKVIGTGMTFAGLLNVRKEASAEETEIVDKLPANTAVSIYEEKTTGDDLWYRIGENRWVIAEWIKRDDKLSEDNWSRIWPIVLDIEGGLSLDPNDSGNYYQGRLVGTKYGISAAVWGDRYDIPNLTKEQALSIYKSQYFDAVGANSLSWPLSLAVFDHAINAGVGSAQKLLAQSNGSFVGFMAERISWYTTVKDFDRYGRAWMNRCAMIMREAIQ